MSSQQVYDGDLQMFVQKPRIPSLGRLKFLRWLAEQGRLEHLPASAPDGPFATTERLGADVSQDWPSAAW